LAEYSEVDDYRDGSYKSFAKNFISDILGIKKEKPVFEIDVSQIPDLVPIICVAAVNTNAVTRIINAKRLRFKESDRIKTSCEMIKSIGGLIFEQDEGIIIHGSENELPGGTVNSYGDHRIAMAAAIAALKTKNGVVIENYNCVDKSYPHFFVDLESVGGKTDELNMGE